MKRTSLVLSCVIIFSCISISLLYAKTLDNLYEAFEKKALVRVFIDDIEDLSDSKGADTVDLKKKLSSALAQRKSIKFKLVDLVDEADIVIDGSVMLFTYSTKDPVDMIMGIWSAAYDVLTTENYAYQEVIFNVTDQKTQNKLWEKTLKIELTKKSMTEEESLPLINKKTVKNFILECFSKSRSNKKR